MGGAGSDAVLADEELCVALAASELMPGLRPVDFAPLAGELRVIDLDPSEELVSKDAEADSLFVVLRGQIQVSVTNEHGVQPLALVGEGGVLGEIGMLTGGARSAGLVAASRSRVVELSDEGFHRLVAAHPAQGEALARRAADRLRRTQVIEHLSSVFGVIDPAALAEVEQLVGWVTVPAGSCLFREGDAGDAAYIVAAGRLRAFRQVGGTEVEIGEVGRAELVGEMSLVDEHPRTASLFAVRDSQLIRFSRAAFDQLLDRYPRVGLEVARIALARSRAAGARDGAGPLSVVVVPISAGVDASAFAEELTAALGPGARRVDSGGVDDELGRAGIAQIDDDDVGALRLAYHLEGLEERNHHLVYEIDDGWTAWSRRALRWADHILLVADAEQDPQPVPLEQELWRLIADHHHPKVSLALLHPAATRLPTGTVRWLEHRDLESHHHVRRADPDHMGRLARLMAGTGTSLVFGGGGARGFAQIGVLEVLEELQVPIDMVGGTSIGSIMGIGPGLGWTAAESRERSVAAFQKLFDYTFPSTSILRGERISSKLEAVIGDVDIADLWVPYFCVSTNLTHARAEYQDRGPLLPAVRASIAIPGVLPPVPHHGDLLVDGGVLDNVPVGEMRRRNPTGTVITVDVAPIEGPTADHDYGLSVSGFRSLFRRHKDGARPPSLVTTMVRSTMVASVRDRQRFVEEGIADLYLDLQVDGGGMLDFGTAEQIADGGAESAREALTEWFAPASAPEPRYVRTRPVRASLVDPERGSRGGGVRLLTLRDLQHRAARFVSVVVGVSVVFALLYLMTGLTEQFHREPREAVAAFDADGWLVREGASGAFTSAATMPADVGSKVDGADARPVVVARHALTQGDAPVDAVLVGFEPGTGDPQVTEGEAPAAPDEVAVDAAASLEIGDEAELGGQTFTVTGLTEDRTLFAGMPLVFMEIDAAQELVYRGQDLATAVLVDGEPTSVPAGYEVLSNEAVADDAMRPLEKSVSSVNIIRILLWFVAAMIIGTMVYLSALERRRDVAVLKAIGGSTSRLGASIALQGALIALTAALLAAVLQRFLTPVFPLAVSVPAHAFVQVPVIAVVIALLAGIVGLRKAVRVDPALAFSGPGA